MRFYAQNSEYPRVIDRRDGFCVYTAEAYDYEQAIHVAGCMNRVWERDVEYTSDFIREHSKEARDKWLETNNFPS